MLREEDILSFVRSGEELSPEFSERILAPEKKYGREKIVFYRGEKPFLVLFQGAEPVILEIRCDRKLARTLQERYESVLPGEVLGRNGLKVICSGQLTREEVLDLVRHGFEEAKLD